SSRRVRTSSQPTSTGRSSQGPVRLDRRNAGELFERGQARDDLLDPVAPERHHAGAHRRPLELLVARLPRSERRQLFIHLEELEDADAALVAGLPAAHAAVAPEQFGLAVPQLVGDVRAVELLLL